MAALPPDRDAADDTDAGPASPPPAPRWVKAFGAAALVALVLFAIAHLAGRGFGSHTSHGSPAGGATPGAPR